MKTGVPAWASFTLAGMVSALLDSFLVDIIKGRCRYE